MANSALGTAKWAGTISIAKNCMIVVVNAGFPFTVEEDKPIRPTILDVLLFVGHKFKCSTRFYTLALL